MPRTFRVAVIGRTGRGNYGHSLDTAWLDIPDATVVAVSDDDKAGLAKAAERLKVDRAYVDFRKMLDDVKPEVVAVCPRWIDQHRDMAVAAAERGIHVYMEKPFCRSLQEADEIVTACQRSHVKLALAHPTRYSPKLETIRRLVEEGRVGTLLEYRARGKEDHRGGAEDLWVLGTHVLDMIHALGGKPSWCFARVTTDGRPITKDDIVAGNEGLGPLAGDAVQAMYGMPDGTTACFASHRKAFGRPSRYGLQMFGSGGVLELLEGVLPSVKYLGDPSWSPARSGKEWQNVSSAGIGKPEPLTAEKYKARHHLAILDLLEAIEKDRQPVSSVYVARDVTEMILAVFESQRLNRPVELPLKNRRHPLRLLG